MSSSPPRTAIPERDPALEYDELAISDRTTGRLLLAITAARPPGVTAANAERNLVRMAECLFPGAFDRRAAAPPLILPPTRN